MSVREKERTLSTGSSWRSRMPTTSIVLRVKLTPVGQFGSRDQNRNW